MNVNQFLNFFLVLLLAVIQTACQTVPDPEPGVFPRLENEATAPDGFYPGEWPVVGVRVTGDDVTAPGVTAKVDIVFLIDESGSMADNDSSLVRRTTIQAILATLDPALHRAAIVVFNDTATLVGGYTSLTTNFTNLSTALSLLPIPDSSANTNMAQAMAVTNSLLGDSTANHRIAILLTDGFPTPDGSNDYDLAQDAEINTAHVPYAIEHDINYYVVHLSAPDWVTQGTTLLQDRIATDTGGEYYIAEYASQIATHIPTIVASASTTLVLKGVSLDVQFRMGPNLYSDIDESNISLAGADAFQVTDSSVTTTPRATLPENQAIYLTVPITSHEPIPYGSPPELTSVELPSLKPTAKVTYHLGDGDIKTADISQVTIKWLRTEQTPVIKRLDRASKKLSISVSNFIREGPITNVRIWEILTRHFEAVYDSAIPPPDRIIPSDHNWRDLVYLYWVIGEIAPMQTKTVEIDTRYLGPTTGLIPVDMIKPASEVHLVDPAGQTRIISTASVDAATKWHGDLTIDAVDFNTDPADSVGTDIYIYSHHVGGAPGEDMSIIPKPVSQALWNDSFSDGGYDEGGRTSTGANVEPVDLNGENALWVRVDNIGNLQVMNGLTVDAYISDSYCACLADYDLSNWQHIGSFHDDRTIFEPGSLIIEKIIWDPNELSTTLKNSLVARGEAYFKVVATVGATTVTKDLRDNNNIAHVLLPVAP